MSAEDDAKKMLTDINTSVKALQENVVKVEEGSATKQEVVDMNIQIKNVEKALEKKDEELEKLTKSIEAEKLKTKQYNEFDKSAQKRAEYMEFLSKLRLVADGELKQFNTNELKSVKELMERKDYNSLDDSVGGVAVIPTLDSTIDKLIREYSMVRSMAETVTVSTDKYEQLKMNQDNGATWEKNLSNFTTQTKDNTLSKLSIAVENLYSFAIFHKNLIADNAFNLVNAILTNSAEDFAIAEGTSFWTGNGVGEMYGILSTSDASDSFDKIERVETAAANTITFEDIYDLIGALKQPYEPNAQFKAHRLTIQVLRKLRSDSGAGAGTGDFLWQPSNIVGVPATLASFPISQATELSSTPLVNNTEAVVFGDFRKGYKIIDRMGLEVMRDDVTQYPYVKYNSHKRVSGGTNKGEALKILKTKSS